MQFTALFIEPNTNANTANLLFADPETNPDEPAVLMLSRAIEFKDSAYYFEINDQSHSSYGGLTAVRLERNQLEIQLAPQVVEKFGNPDFATVQVAFEVDDATYQTVRATLQNILANTPILTVVEN